MRGWGHITAVCYSHLLGVLPHYWKYAQAHTNLLEYMLIHSHNWTHASQAIAWSCANNRQYCSYMAMCMPRMHLGCTHRGKLGTKCLVFPCTMLCMHYISTSTKINRAYVSIGGRQDTRNREIHLVLFLPPHSEHLIEETMKTQPFPAAQQTHLVCPFSPVQRSSLMAILCCCTLGGATWGRLTGDSSFARM